MRNSHNAQNSPDPNRRQATDVSTTPPTADTTSAGDSDPLRHIAEQVADCFADSGYAFVEEDRIDGLAATLGSFLTVAGIPVTLPEIDDPSWVATGRTSPGNL